MLKSLYRPEHAEFSRLLRDLRVQAGFTQEAFGAKLERPQTFVSAIERGHTRLDYLQVREWCRACGTTMPAFAALFEDRVAALPDASRKRHLGPKSFKARPEKENARRDPRKT